MNDARVSGERMTGRILFAALAAGVLTLAATGCIERLPPRPPPEVPPYPQEKFDSPLNAWHEYQRADDLRRQTGVKLNLEARDWWLPLTAEKAAKWAEYLHHHQPAIQALDRAAAAPYCVVPEHGGLLRPGMRELGRLLSRQGHVRRYRGDTAGAVDSWLDAIELGHDVMQEGVLIARLGGMAIDEMGLKPAIDLVKRGEGTAEDYREIIRRLGEMEADRFPYPATLRREFVSGRRDLEDLPLGKPAAMAGVLRQARAEWKEEGAQGAMAALRERLAMWTQRDVILDNYDTCWSLVIEDAQRPYAQIDPNLSDLWSHDPINRIWVASHSRTRVRELYDVARLRALVVMAALQLYRLDNGKLPPTLDALRPDYLAELPRDPFSEDPLRYLRLPDDRFVVYSMGPDEDDDRAEVEFEWRRGPQADGDIIFREEEGKE